MSLPNSKGKSTAFFPGHWACRCCSLMSSREGVGHSILRSQGLLHLSPVFVLSVTGPYSVILSDLKLTPAAQVNLGLLAIFLLWLPKAEITEVSHSAWPCVFLRGAIRQSLCQGSHSDSLQCRRMEWGQKDTESTRGRPRLS